jgi:hypothetical protein
VTVTVAAVSVTSVTVQAVTALVSTMAVTEKSGFGRFPHQRVWVWPAKASNDAAAEV